jgi:hypothetical protein
MFIFLEYILVAVVIVAAYFLPTFPSRWIETAETILRRLAARRTLSVFMVGALALAIRAVLLLNFPVPPPGLHDDFCYLLAADTFAHGRLTNPTHPLWVHFETIYVNQKPTYMSMFYPAQGLLLALGQVLTGIPWMGSWLAAGLMCAAICWMLQGWLPAGWALMGGLLAVMRLGTFTYWVNSYSGGCLAAMGGALVLGALPRIKRHRRIRDALLMGAGFALLGNTRPYESLFFGIPIVAVMLAWMLGKDHPPFRQSIPRIMLPIACVLLVTAACMAYFFWRVTGSPFRTPFQVNIDTYYCIPYFPWLPVHFNHQYNHPLLKQFFSDSWQLYVYRHARHAPLSVLMSKISSLCLFFLGPLLGLPVVVALFAGPRRFLHQAIAGKTGFLLTVCGIAFIGLALPIYFIPHYAAPITAAIYALVLQSMRYLRLWNWRGKRAGLGIVRAIPALCILLFLIRAFAPQLHIPTPTNRDNDWAGEQAHNWDRALALAQLKALPGNQLVIVRYNQYHESDNEWVYNRADIDSAKVVWARDMGDAKNAELIHYFSQRRVWLAEPDLAPPRLSPYPFPPDQPAPARSSP